MLDVLDKLAEHLGGNLVLSRKSGGHHVKAVDVRGYVDSGGLVTAAAHGVGNVVDKLLFNTQHKVDSAHTAVAVNEENFFIKFNQGNRQTDGNGGLTRTSLSGGDNDDFTHKQYLVVILAQNSFVYNKNLCKI